MSFTIDELELTTDNQSNPIWYVEDEIRAVGLHPEQEFVAKQLYLAKALDWEIKGISDVAEIHVVHADEPVVIPIRKAVCIRCRGKGTMANPAFNGTSIEWWQEHGGPDYQDDLDEYMHGDLYDVSCEYNCSGGVAWTMDWQRVIDYGRAYGEMEKADEWINELYQEIQDWWEGESEMRAEQAYFNREWAI